MDLSLTDEQQDFRRAARAFLDIAARHTVDPPSDIGIPYLGDAN